MMESYRPNQNAVQTYICHASSFECGHECPHASSQENEHTLHIIVSCCVVARKGVASSLASVLRFDIPGNN
jgi:hypothetical protein